MKSIKINKEYAFQKIGMDEVKGLEKSLREIAKPLLDVINDKIYWDDKLDFEAAEYTSRDGFIPNRSNCGGIQLNTIIPSCEECGFSYLEFGECDPKYCDCHTEDANECSLDIDGHKDAKLRIWLKFEGIEDGELKFWFYLGGGNQDAPYFRHGSEATIFEESFTCKSLAGLTRKGNAVVKRMLKAMG